MVKRRKKKQTMLFLRNPKNKNVSIFSVTFQRPRFYQKKRRKLSKMLNLKHYWVDQHLSKKRPRKVKNMHTLKVVPMPLRTRKRRKPRGRRRRRKLRQPLPRKKRSRKILTLKKLLKLL